MIYLRALRLHFLFTSVLNFLVCWFALTSRTGKELAWALTGVVLAHLAANLWNDYFDQKADAVNLFPTAFSGGSRVLQEKRISSGRFLAFTLLFSLAAAGVALRIFWMAGVSPALLGVTVVSALLLFFYTAPPFRLVYRGWGEPSIFLTFGPLLLLGISAFLKIPPTFSALMVSFIAGFLTARLLFVNEFPDYEADRNAGKKNWVVRLGLKKARWITPLFGVSAVLCGCLAGFPSFGLVFALVIGVLETVSFFLPSALSRCVVAQVIHLVGVSVCLGFLWRLP